MRTDVPIFIDASVRLMVFYDLTVIQFGKCPLLSFLSLLFVDVVDDDEDDAFQVGFFLGILQKEYIFMLECSNQSSFFLLVGVFSVCG